jgi:hypothetical protein
VRLHLVVLQVDVIVGREQSVIGCGSHQGPPCQPGSTVA